MWDAIWVLGVSAVGRSGWGTRSGFWGFRRWVAVGRGPDLGFGGCSGVGIRLGLMVTVCCRCLAMVAERGRREINGFFF